MVVGLSVQDTDMGAPSYNDLSIPSHSDGPLYIQVKALSSLDLMWGIQL